VAALFTMLELPLFAKLKACENSGQPIAISRDFLP
jgi:hypothetical protein